MVAEVKFIERAALVLSECHCVLRNSYISSYYLGASRTVCRAAAVLTPAEDEESTEKQLFLFLQAELEKTTTALAGALEAPNITRRRTEVVDLSVLAQTKTGNLLSAMEHGLDD